MPATTPLRQSFPRWQVTPSAAAPDLPARGAKIIPFPEARSRRARVVTYPQELPWPSRIAPSVPPPEPLAARERRIMVVTMLALALAGALTALA